MNSDMKKRMGFSFRVIDWLASLHPMWVIGFDVLIAMFSLCFSFNSLQRTATIIGFSGAVLFLSSFISTVVKLDLLHMDKGQFYKHSEFLEVFAVHNPQQNPNQPSHSSNSNRMLIGFLIGLTGS